MVRYSIGALVLLAASPAAAQVEETPAKSSDIVVTGQSIAETAGALKACIFSHCPVDKDVAATLRHAENLFVSGDYKNARRTLLASLGRNKRQSEAYPVAVAALYRASGRVAAHLGEGEAYRINTIDSIDALKAGLPDNDPRVLAQRVEIGDMFADIGRPDAAAETYRTVVKQARAARLPTIEGPARLRIANLKVRAAGSRSTNSGSANAAIKEIDDFIADRDPSMEPYQFVARVMKARLLARQGDTAPFEKLVAELRTRPISATPVLLDAKPVTLDQTAALRNHLTWDSLLSQSQTANIPSGEFDDQWIDVSYWIKSDGTVADAEVVRESKNSFGNWSDEVMKSVRSRQYAPLPLAAADPGMLRVERYTYTAFIRDTITGSRMRTRSNEPRIEVLDLTREPASTRS